MKKILILGLILINLFGCKKKKEDEAPLFSGFTQSVVNSAGTGITFSWNKANDDFAPPEEINYKLYRGDLPGDLTLLAEIKGDTTYTADGFTPNRTYYFAILAQDNVGQESQRYEYSIVTASFERHSKIKSYNINAMLSVEQSLWIGTSRGIIIWDYSKDSIKYFDRENNNFTDKSPENNDSANLYVTDLTKDNQGNIWIATQGKGMIKYNPDKNLWNTFNSSSDGLLDDYVKIIRQGKNNIMWIGTNAGLNGYIEEDSLWLRYHKGNTSYLMPDDSISAIAIEGTRNIWVGTPNEGIRLYDASESGNPWVSYCKQIGPETVMPYLRVINYIAIEDGDVVTEEDKDILSHAGDSPVINNQKIWFGTEDGGAIVYYGGKGTMKCGDEKDLRYWKYYLAVSESGENEIASNRVKKIFIEKIDQKFIYWFGTNRGISRYDRKKWEKFTREDGVIADNSVSSIAKDSNGNFWFGTGVGAISKYDTAKGIWNIYSINGPLDDNVRFVNLEKISEATDINGVKKTNYLLWLVTDKGLTRFESINNSWTNIIPSKQGLSGETISAFAIDSRGIKWIGTENGLNKFDGEKWALYTTANNQLIDNNITALGIDKDDNVWIGTKSGVSVYDQKNSWTNYTMENTNSQLVNNYINVIRIDKEKQVKWFGTQGGLSYFNGKEWKTYNKSDGLVDNNVISLEIGEGNEIWAGTKQGASRFTGTGWNTYTQNSGLPDNQVNSIAIDLSGNIWFGTVKGLVRLNNNTWIPYKNEGSGDEFINSVIVDAKGNLWIGTKGGLTKFGNL